MKYKNKIMAIMFGITAIWLLYNLVKGLMYVFN